MNRMNAYKTSCFNLRLTAASISALRDCERIRQHDVFDSRRDDHGARKVLALVTVMVPMVTPEPALTWDVPRAKLVFAPVIVTVVAEPAGAVAGGWSARVRRWAAVD